MSFTGEKNDNAYSIPGFIIKIFKEWKTIDEKIYEQYTSDYIKKIESELRQHENDYSLSVTDELWENFELKYMPRYGKQVKKLLSDHIEMLAENIFKDEAKKYPRGYYYELKEGTRIPTEILNRALCNYSENVFDDKKPDTELLEDYIQEFFLERIEMCGGIDEEVEVNRIFRENRKDRPEELEIVDLYLNEQKWTVCDALSDEMQLCLHFDLEKAMGTQNIRFLNVRTAAEYDSFNIRYDHLTDIFNNGNIEELNRNLSQMDNFEQCDHFDTFLVALVYGQGSTLKEFTQAYLGPKKTGSKFLNDLVTALRQYPELSQINICTTLTARDFNALPNIYGLAQCVTFPEGTRIELSDDNDLTVDLELDKCFVMQKDISFTPEFVEVTDAEPLWKGAVKAGGEAEELYNTEGFEKDVSDTVKYIEKLDKSQKKKSVSRSDKGK